MIGDLLICSPCCHETSWLWVKSPWLKFQGEKMMDKMGGCWVGEDMYYSSSFCLKFCVVPYLLCFLFSCIFIKPALSDVISFYSVAFVPCFYWWNISGGNRIDSRKITDEVLFLFPFIVTSITFLFSC